VQKELTRKGHYEGTIALPELARLGELLYPAESAQAEPQVAVQFEFLHDEYDVPLIAGRLQVRLTLQCQRCLQALDMPMELVFRLMIDASDELVRDSSRDTIYSKDGWIDLFEVIEDELILALPLVVLHEDTACNEYWQAQAAEADVSAKENPFSVLQQLKTTD
jgi:uncharacterized protein